MRLFIAMCLGALMVPAGAGYCARALGATEIQSARFGIGVLLITLGLILVACVMAALGRDQ